ncbi:unnamed protein product [Miscanthus lutarioriparius]|uniref:Methyltransferase n=1 Tax=Miscanthus lutarioriparius TaxID=422564 RepID=A0A811P205_9POAL|nr:unnamed protein product [Miscanthus lutarioriparius]
MRPPPPQGRGAGGGGALGRRAFASLLAAAVVALALLCLFYGAAFAPSIRRAHPRLPLWLRFRAQGTEALPADLVVSFIPVCDARHSELIPCLDRRLHYQLRLRLNLSLMEHYERHCPPAPRRLNCLIPPPVGYQDIWHSRVIQYWKHMKSEIRKDSFRNVMDMSTNLGGFAASLKKKDVWVMNVVPFTESGKLKVIYDRGLMGTTHDWCESFSTYPRTYDLLHAWLLFSEIEKQGCSLEDLLIEMDRILRPYGYAIIRDKAAVVNYIKKLLPALRWMTGHLR